MAYNEALAERIRTLLADNGAIAEKKMFGGLAFLLNGNMCCGVVKDELMVRVGPDSYDAALLRPHARVMDFTGRPMKGMVFVSAEGLDSEEDLRYWVERGTAFASALPAK